MDDKRKDLIDQLKHNKCPECSFAAGVIYGQATFIGLIEKSNKDFEEEIRTLKSKIEDINLNDVL
jgi:hypothetical protein